MQLCTYNLHSVIDRVKNKIPVGMYRNNIILIGKECYIKMQFSTYQRTKQTILSVMLTKTETVFKSRNPSKLVR